MNLYAITFARSARRELEALEANRVRRIWSRIEALATEPRPAGSRKLQGGQHHWRIRVGDYRVVYTVDDRARVVDVVAVRHRKDVYR
jgi:mRNA interferase RelE/StbE